MRRRLGGSPRRLRPPDRGDDVVATLPDGHRGRVRCRASRRAGSPRSSTSSSHGTGGELTSTSCSQARGETGLDAARGRRDPGRRVRGDRDRLATSTPRPSTAARPTGDCRSASRSRATPTRSKPSSTSCAPRLRRPRRVPRSRQRRRHDRDRPRPGLRAELLEDGELGDTDVFQDVVREAEDAAAVLFVNFDAGDGWLVEVAGDDEEVADNLEPLRARHERLGRRRRRRHCVLGSRPTDRRRSVPADPVHGRPGDPDQVGRGDLQVEPAATARDEDGRVVERRTVDHGRVRRASARPARCRRRRSRWPARRRRRRPSPPCCRRAPGPAP